MVKGLKNCTALILCIFQWGGGEHRMDAQLLSAATCGSPSICVLWVLGGNAASRAWGQLHGGAKLTAAGPFRLSSRSILHLIPAWGHTHAQPCAARSSCSSLHQCCWAATSLRLASDHSCNQHWLEQPRVRPSQKSKYLVRGGRSSSHPPRVQVAVANGTNVSCTC